jgi:hypothetical protein
MAAAATIHLVAVAIGFAGSQYSAMRELLAGRPVRHRPRVETDVLLSVCFVAAPWPIRFEDWTPASSAGL